MRIQSCFGQRKKSSVARVRHITIVQYKVMIREIKMMNEGEEVCIRRTA